MQQTVTTTMAGLLALAVSVSGQTAHFAVMTSPTNNQMLAAGDTLNIKWQPGDATGKITIGLIGGETQNKQVPLKDLTTSQDITTGTFSWDIDCSLGKDKFYGLKITSNDDESLSQYSFPFHIQATDDVAGCAIGKDGSHGDHTHPGHNDGGSDGGDDSPSSYSTPTEAPSTLSPLPPSTTISDTFSETPTTVPPPASTTISSFTTSATTTSVPTTMSPPPAATTITDPAPTATTTSSTTGSAPTGTTPTGTAPTGGNGGSSSSSTPSPSANPDNAAAGLKVSFGAALVAGLVAFGFF